MITASISLPGAPSQTLYDPTTGGIYVLRSQLGRVTEIDPTTHTVVRSWNVTAPSPSFAIDAAADRLYVADYNNLAIDLYRLSDGAPLGNLSALSPSIVQYCPETGRVYAIAGFAGNQVLAIDPGSDTIVANGTIGVLGSAIACDPFNGDVYVANQRSQNVSVLNGTTLAGVASLANGNYGAGVAYDSLNAEIVAAATADDNVTVDGTVNRTLTAIVAVGEGPGSVAFGAAHDTFYVANVDSGTVSLLHPNTDAPRIASLSLRPLVLYEPTNSTFNASASATSDYGIPCPPGVAYTWTVAPSALATPSGINASTEEFTTTGHLGVGAVVLNASFGGATVTVSVPLQIYGPPPVPLASAVIAPSSASLLVGGTQAFTASALLVGGAPAPATSIFSWTLAPPSIGALNTTSGTGVLFTAAGAGAGTLSLSVYYAGSYAFSTSSITVRTAAPQVVVRLALTPLAPTVSAGGNVTFAAVAYDAAGRNVSAIASYHWQLHAPSEGTLAIAPGYRQSYEAGNASGVDVLTVTASLGGASVSQNTSITVVGSIGPCCSGGTTGGSSPFDALLHVPWWAWGIGAAILLGVGIALYRWRRPPTAEAELVDAPSFRNAYLALDEPVEEPPSAPPEP
ncbi:MAG: YncE family protein [Thermoplasmata archaeon]|nr:YncE family protein [Thermoplasmata archaeon]